MRHKKGYRKLNKASDQRKALLISLARGVFQCGKITTSKMRALEARKLVEKIIALAKKGDMYSRRKAYSLLPSSGVIKEIFLQSPERFKNYSGGATRITNLGSRRGDASKMVMLELL